MGNNELLKEEFFARIGLGLEVKNGWSSTEIFAQRENVVDGDIIKPWGGPDIDFPSLAGETVEIVGGVGENITMLVFGISEGKFRNIVIVTNGNTPVTLPGTWSRFNGLRNIGQTPMTSQVSIRRPGSGEEFIVALPGDHQRSLQAVVSCPAGYRIGALNILNSLEKVGGSDYSLVNRLYSITGNGPEVLEFTSGLQRSGNTSASYDNRIAGAIFGPATLLARANTSSSSVGSCSIWANIIIVKTDMMRK